MRVEGSKKRSVPGLRRIYKGVEPKGGGKRKNGQWVSLHGPSGARGGDGIKADKEEEEGIRRSGKGKKGRRKRG